MNEDSEVEVEASMDVDQKVPPAPPVKESLKKGHKRKVPAEGESPSPKKAKKAKTAAS